MSSESPSSQMLQPSSSQDGWLDTSLIAGAVRLRMNWPYSVVAVEDELHVFRGLEPDRKAALAQTPWLIGSQVILSQEDQRVAAELIERGVLSPGAKSTSPQSVGGDKHRYSRRLVCGPSLPANVVEALLHVLPSTHVDDLQAASAPKLLEVRIGGLYGDLLADQRAGVQVLAVLMQGSGLALGPLIDVTRGSACLSCLAAREVTAMLELLGVDIPFRLGCAAMSSPTPNDRLTELLVSSSIAYVARAAAMMEHPSRQLLSEIVRVDYFDWTIRRAAAFPLLHCPSCGEIRWRDTMAVS